MLPAVRHTLYQVSTATALVEGIYEGAVTIATLRKHGKPKSKRRLLGA
jgi:alpha-acetolactate decarboxylase